MFLMFREAFPCGCLISESRICVGAEQTTKDLRHLLLINNTWFKKFKFEEKKNKNFGASKLGDEAQQHNVLFFSS